MPKRDRAADGKTDLDGHPVEAKRVRKPAAFRINGIPIAWIGGQYICWGLIGVCKSPYDMRRLAAWFTRAAAWIDQQEPKHG